MKKYTDYGIDAPGIIKKLMIASIVLSGAYFLIFYKLYIFFSYSWLLPWAYFVSISTFISMIGTSLMMLWSSKVGKLWQRDRLLSQISWQGNEKVLDVGCGRGLLLIGVAKKLNLDGKAIGIDTWNQEDLKNNSAQATYDNAKIEGIENRIEIQTGDVQQLSFVNDSFDVIVSSLVIHNIKTKKNRDLALNEMLRVLKPNGTLLLQDIFYTKEYFQYFQQHKNLQITISNLQWYIFPPVRMLIVKKI